MQFTLQQLKQISFLKCDFRHLYIIGYAGRDEEKTLLHIKELERDLNVAPPKQIPTIFECSRRILTSESNLDIYGNQNSGEAEYVMIIKQDKIYIGLGSDHTDRALESYDVAKSKEIMPKVLSKVFWDYDEIKGHFDEIRLVSFQKKSGENFVYQDGRLSDILPPERILQELKNRVGNIDECVIFSGTVPLLGKFYYGDFFKAQMIDERLDRVITLEYNINFISEEER